MATSTWKAGTSGTWEIAANWTTPLPGAADTATFDGITPENVSITAQETIDQWSINGVSAALLLGVGDKLTTTNNIPTSTTTLNIDTNDGTITVNGGGVSIVGNYAGTGGVTIENNGRFGVGAGDSNTGTITFGAGTSNILDFDTPQAAASNIANMTTGDVIALSTATFNVSNQPTYSNGVLTYTDAPGKTYTLKLVTPSTNAFHVVADTVNGGQGVDIVTGAPPPPPPPPAAANFAYTDTTTNTAGTSAGTPYSGPVSSITEQYIWSGSDNVALSANTGSVFMHGGPGDDALTAISGTNVLDGGAGSNFLVGAPGGDGGFDTFFDDGRGGGVTWDTLVHFHQGDAVTIFGFTGGLSTMQWADNQGATGYQGATMHSELAGAGTGINATVTFAGLSVADAQAKLTISTGNVDGNAYLYLKYA